jgi:phosphotransferase system IIB component
MFNSFIKSFEPGSSRAGRSMIDEITNEANVRAGINGTVDVMESMVQKGDVVDFSIDKVKAGTNIFDATKIRFSPKDTSNFNINKFMRNLGLSDVVDDVGQDKMTAILGGKAQSKEFEKFLTYMKAISDTPIADTSTFMQRRLQLGGLGSLTGALVLGGSAAVNPICTSIIYITW